MTFTNVSLKYIYKIIKKFEDFPYEGCLRKRSKYVPTDSYSIYKDSLLSVL